MILIKSTFWLVAAYFVLVPQLQIARTVEDLSVQALGTGQRVALEQINNTRCQSVECMGAKVVLSASVGALVQNETPLREPARGAINLNIPVPQPRLSRPG